jgi:hypothetical protein
MSAGFFIHPCLAISQKTGSLLGLLSAKIWTRSNEYDPTPSHLRKAEDKESFRWQEGAMKAAECLKGIAASIVVVADREGDIYGAFANRPKNVDLVVRASHDRQLCGDGLLFDAPKAWPELARAQIEVPPQRKQNTVISPARTATVTMRAGVVEIPRPRQGYDADTPESVSLTLVEIQEVDPPANAEPVVWRLLTSMEVKTAEDVREIVLIYKMRWKIEIDQSWGLSRIRVGCFGRVGWRRQASPGRGRCTYRFERRDSVGIGMNKFDRATSCGRHKAAG